MKITGTKSYIQIEEENGNVARFDGEACLGEFYAYASPSDGSATGVRRPMGTGSILRFVWAPLYLPVRFSSAAYGCRKNHHQTALNCS